MKTIITLLFIAASTASYCQTATLPKRIINSERDGNLRTMNIFYGDLQTNSTGNTATLNYVKELWVINSPTDSIMIKGEWKSVEIPIATNPNAAYFIAPQAADAIRNYLQVYEQQQP